MKTLIQLVVVALIVGGLSAGGSFYVLQNEMKAQADKAKMTADADARAAEESSAMNQESTGNAEVDEGEMPDPVAVKPQSKTQIPFSEALVLEPPVGARPSYVSESDEAGILINKLRMRESSTTDRERRLLERQETMELILGDLRVEQSEAAKTRQRYTETMQGSLQSIDELRKVTDTERGAGIEMRNVLRRKADEKAKALRKEKEMAMEAAEEAVKSARNEREAAEAAVKEARRERDALQNKLDEMSVPAEKRDLSGSPEKNANLAKLAKLLDGMPPESTAGILLEMLKKGNNDGVVAVIDKMTPRISAKVLSSIAESKPTVAVDLAERLKQFKTQ